MALCFVALILDVILMSLYMHWLCNEIFFCLRMEQSGKEAQPDDESCELIVGMHFQAGQIDTALKYVDKTLKYGNMLSMRVFSQCVSHCVDKGRLDVLVSIIEKCKVLVLFD